MSARFSATVLPVTVIAVAVEQAGLEQLSMTTGTPPMRSTSLMWYLPWGLASAMWGRAPPPC